MICKELNKTFDSNEAMFKALKENKEDLINIKRSEIFKSCDRGSGIPVLGLDLKSADDTTKGLFSDKNYYYVVVNTTNVLDSHGDVHVKGIWNKTAKEQQGKNYLVTDHKMELSNVVGKKGDIEMFVTEIPFSSVGKGYEGNTQALVYKLHKDKALNGVGKEWLDSGDDIEASVRMQYVKIDLAMNSNDREHQAELKNYNDNLNNIANKADFEEITHFWIVSEAKNIGESSLVLAGSNSSTGTIEAKDIQPSNDTVEPSTDTQEEKSDKVSDINYFNFI